MHSFSLNGVESVFFSSFGDLGFGYLDSSSHDQMCGFFATLLFGEQI